MMGKGPAIPYEVARGKMPRPQPVAAPRLKSHEAIHAPQKPKADGERFPKRREPEYVTWFGKQGYPCAVHDAQGRATVQLCWGQVERAHLKSRGAGGADTGNIVPLCTGHHQRLHRIGQRQFEYEIGKKLRPIAKRIESLFYAEKKHGPRQKAAK